MKKYLICAITALFATIAVSIATPDKDALMANEKAAWQSFKDKNSGEFRKLMHADFMAVYQDGIYTLQKEMDLMPKMDMKSFSFSDCSVVFSDPTTATVTCKVAVEGTLEGKDISGNYYSGSVWRKQGDKWIAIFHSDMPEEKPAAK